MYDILYLQLLLNNNQISLCLGAWAGSGPVIVEAL